MYYTNNGSTLKCYILSTKKLKWIFDLHVTTDMYKDARFVLDTLIIGHNMLSILNQSTLKNKLYDK